MLEAYGAVVVHQGAFAGVYHENELITLVRHMTIAKKKFGPYGAYWTYDGDCFFEECGIALAGLPEAEDVSFYGRGALDELQAWVVGFDEREFETTLRADIRKSAVAISQKFNDPDVEGIYQRMIAATSVGA